MVINVIFVHQSRVYSLIVLAKYSDPVAKLATLKRSVCDVFPQMGHDSGGTYSGIIRQAKERFQQINQLGTHCLRVGK